MEHKDGRQTITCPKYNYYDKPVSERENERDS